MFGLSLSEVVFLAILALVVIGPKQLPEVARTLGRFLNELRRTTSILTDDFKSHVRFDPLELDKAPVSKKSSPEVPAHEPMVSATKTLPEHPMERQLKFDLTPEGTTESSKSDERPS